MPTIIRSNRGSENTVIGGIQMYLRQHHQDTFSGEKSFRYGSSINNQRIESWWSFFQKHRSDWWINLFKDFCDEGSYDPTNDYQRMCLLFFFNGLLQTDLDDMKRMWNNHTIRNSREAESPGGKPDVLFYTTEATGGENKSAPLNERSFQVVKSLLKNSGDSVYSEEFLKLVAIVMNEDALNIPTSIRDTKLLYLKLVEEIERYL